MLNKIVAVAMFAMLIGAGSALAQMPPDTGRGHHPPPDSMHPRPDSLRPHTPPDSMHCPRVARQAMEMGRQIERMSGACTDTGAAHLFNTARRHLEACHTAIMANNCELARTELQAATRDLAAARRLCHGTAGGGHNGGDPTNPPGGGRPGDPGTPGGDGGNGGGRPGHNHGG